MSHNAESHNADMSKEAKRNRRIRWELRAKVRKSVPFRPVMLYFTVGIALVAAWSLCSWQWQGGRIAQLDQQSNQRFDRAYASTQFRLASYKLRPSSPPRSSIAPTIANWQDEEQSSSASPSPGQDEPSFSAADVQFFEAEVRPILVERCGECHGVDSAMEAGLSTASRAALLRGGDTGPAIVPGQPGESLILDAISYDGIYQMPPDSKLPEAEIATLHEWVERNAPWTPTDAETLANELGAFDLDARKAEHWCWQPIIRPSPPEVKNSEWVFDPMDRFILARLEQAGIAPNPPASKSEWLRRVYFDLIGLPPRPAEVQAFLQDDDEQAFERVVDRLLDSPRFGERWARHWMDLVRYAESCGHEFDYPIPAAWRYRDYLIRAFNADVPYDQLVREHIAGDLLAEPRRNPESKYNESIIGTGFWYLHEATHAPVDVRADEAGRVDNQIDVLSKTFLGLTVACARCHDHKFDAISTKDYYALAGFIQSSHRDEVVLDVDRHRELATSRLKKSREDFRSTYREAIESKRPTIADLETILSSLQWIAPDPQDQVEGAEPVDSGKQPNEDASAIEPPSVATTPDDPAWLLALKRELASDAANQPSHPLYALRQLVMSGNAMDQRQTAAQKLAKDLTEQQRQYEKAIEDSVLFADFSEPASSDWYLSGNAFEFLAPNEWSLPGPLANPVAGVTRPGSLASGGISGKLYGAARSKTFTITHSRIHHLMQAKQGEVRLVIDGFMMNRFSALLFSDANHGNINTDGEMKWVQQSGDIGRYIGHRAHLEVIDHGDGYVNLKQIRFSNSDPPPAQPHPWLLAQIRESAPDTKTWYSHYANLLRDCLVDEFHRAAESAMDENLSDQQEAVLARTKVELASALASRLTDRSESSSSTVGEELSGFEHLARLLHQAQQIEDTIEPATIVTAIADGSGEDEHVFVRGNHRVMGQIAERQFLSALTEQWPTSIAGSGRLELARRIANDDNPLTSRVIVNRLWHHLFGVGIVPSVDNFGVLGKTPTHPELLDYLAREFSGNHQWSIKSMLKRMVLSQTYRMSSHPSEIGNRIDPENTLLHRMRIRRLEGEAIRDAMLVVSGKLDETMYGPSIPVHLTPFMQGRGRPGKSGPIDGGNRRSIYLEVRRNFLNPMMLAFDTPIPFSTVGRRNRSNVPAQALILLNDPFVQQQAELWADRLLQDTDATNRERIQTMYQQAYLRPATKREVDDAIGFLQRQTELYASESVSDVEVDRERNVQLTSTEMTNTETHAAPVLDRRAWSDLAHVLFNVKEFIYLK